MHRFFIVLFSLFCLLLFADEKKQKNEQTEWWFEDVVKAREEANNKGALLLLLFFSDDSPLCQRLADNLSRKNLGDTAEKVVPLKFRELDDYRLQQKWLLHTPPVVLLIEPKSETVLARLEELEKLSTASEWVKEVLATQKTLEELKERVKEKPDDAEALFRLAEVELLRGLEDDAQTHLERALKSDKENEKGYALKAAVHLLPIYFKKGRKSDVQSTAGKIKKWDKENKGGHCDDADFFVAKSIQFLDRLKDAAKRRWEEFLKNYPKSELRGEALLYLGLLEFAKGNREEAKKHWEEALKIAPKESVVARKAKGYIDNMNIPTPEKKETEKKTEPKKREKSSGEK